MPKLRLGGRRGGEGSALGKSFLEQANEARKKIRNLKRERAYIIDQKGNVIATLQGKEDQVTTPKEVIREIQRGQLDFGKNYGFIHNHPSGSTFSPEDINAMIRRGYVEMWAVTKDGTYRIRSKSPTGGGNMVLATQAEELLTRLQLGDAYEYAVKKAEKRKFVNAQERFHFIREEEDRYTNKQMDRFYRNNAEKNGLIYSFEPNRKKR